MDDTYLKSIFWTLIILYTVVAIGIWENFAKPIFIFVLQVIWPFLTRVF